MRDTIDQLVLLHECNEGEAKTHLKRFRLTDAEWQLLEHLMPILRILERATVKMSSASYPTLHQVIPLMDLLNKQFEKLLDDTTLPAVIHHAIARALAVLDKYYFKTDDSIMWKIAMSVSILSIACHRS
jgi:hypothetical protein